MRPLSSVVVALGLLLLGSPFSLSAGMCDRWKGKSFTSGYSSKSSVCIGGCNARAVDQDGNTMRWQIDGTPCGRSFGAEVAPVGSAPRVSGAAAAGSVDSSGKAAIGSQGGAQAVARPSPKARVGGAVTLPGASPGASAGIPTGGFAIGKGR